MVDMFTQSTVARIIYILIFFEIISCKFSPVIFLMHCLIMAEVFIVFQLSVVSLFLCSFCCLLTVSFVSFSETFGCQRMCVFTELYSHQLFYFSALAFFSCTLFEFHI